jgi:hypothetical protein
MRHPVVETFTLFGSEHRREFGAHRIEQQSIAFEDALAQCELLLGITVEHCTDLLPLRPILRLDYLLDHSHHPSPHSHSTELIESAVDDRSGRERADRGSDEECSKNDRDRFRARGHCRLSVDD